MKKIRIEGISKVFCENNGLARELLEKGCSREELLNDYSMTMAVDKATFDIQKGEIFVIMGLSGSGKSTLVRLLNRIIEPTCGKIWVDGKDITQLSYEELVEFRRSEMSMVFQSFALMPHMTIVENTALGLEFSKVSEKKRRDIAMKKLKQVGLADWADHYPHELSGGMQQRVGLARALAVSPNILLMDEAFSALDPLIRSDMQDELLKIHSVERSTTIVFISHDLEEALKIGDRIAIMNSGQVVQVGTPKEILLNPVDEYVRTFFSKVDTTGIVSAKEVLNYEDPLVLKSTLSENQIINKFESVDKANGYVVDENSKYIGVLKKEDIKKSSEGLKQLTKKVKPILHHRTMNEILPRVANEAQPIPVVDEKGLFLGTISKTDFLNELVNINGVKHV